jgi:hypothetical protein
MAEVLRCERTMTFKMKRIMMIDGYNLDAIHFKILKYDMRDGEAFEEKSERGLFLP